MSKETTIFVLSAVLGDAEKGVAEGTLIGTLDKESGVKEGTHDYYLVPDYIKPFVLIEKETGVGVSVSESFERTVIEVYSLENNVNKVKNHLLNAIRGYRANKEKKFQEAVKYEEVWTPLLLSSVKD